MVVVVVVKYQVVEQMVLVEEVMDFVSVQVMA